MRTDCAADADFAVSFGYDRESVLKVSALRPDGYLLKSMDPKDIIKAIDDFFEKKKCQMLYAMI